MSLNKSGIYKIISKSQGKCYIGSSISINKRWNTHICYLRKGNHPNKYLQNVYNKYGEDDLVFEVVLFCEPEHLLVTEEEQIKKHDSYKNGFNLISKPVLGFRGCEHSDNSKRQMSIAAKKRGRTNGLLTEEQIVEIRQKFFDGEKTSSLAKEYKIHVESIRNCVYLRTYLDVPCEIEGYNEMIKTLLIARENGGRPRSRGWKQSQEHIEKMRKINSKPNKKNRKLSDEQVREIRKMSANGSTYKEIAELFPVNQMSISKIVRRITYAEVK